VATPRKRTGKFSVNVSVVTKKSTRIKPLPIGFFLGHSLAHFGITADRMAFMANFLLEVGTEELPASFVSSALQQWRERIPVQLEELSLPVAQVQVYGTPRRLAVLLVGLPEKQSDRLVESKGPALSAAFVDGDPKGEPTKALLGFMRAKGVTLQDLVVKETEKGAFVYAVQKLEGQTVEQILQSVAVSWITSLEGKRLMRWGHGDLRFPRPIRWLVALWNESVMPLQLGSIQSDRYSQGHRVLHPQPVRLDRPEDYLDTLAQAGVIADPVQRQQSIRQQIAKIGAELSAQPKVPEELLAEVVNLVELPTAIVGEFEAAFLSLPPEVVETEMISHQRYFPLYDAGGTQLLPKFITISNGDPARSAVIAQGNARVIRARLSDGKFFYDSDRSQPLASFLPALAKVTFQEQLGSVSDKVARMQTIWRLLCAHIPNLVLSQTQKEQIERTIHLCKADLVSQMVKEFPELQGIMGGYYAIASGEPAAVAQGIREHYRPIPSCLTAQITAVCDRLDTLVGIFSLGLLPTGSSDPFALRRAAVTIVQMAWHEGWALNLSDLLPEVVKLFPCAEPEQLVCQVLRWFQQRIANLLQEQGIDYDLVDALFGNNDWDYTKRSLSNVMQILHRAQFLQASRNNGSLTAVYAVVNRASRLAVQAEGAISIQPDKFCTSAETNLYRALQGLPSPHRYEELMSALVDIAPLLAEFFDQVLVMAEDPVQRTNRLGLLQAIRDYSRHLADFSCLNPANS
jgi:glycyl-tRNA synthetase beta chain